MIILGIDPGLNRMGYGLIAMNNETPEVVDFGLIKTFADEKLHIRLQKIHNDIQTIIELNTPSAMAVENVFYAKNVKSMMKLGHARGMALLCAAQKDIPLYEYSPRKVKQAVTGNGNASKEQVGYMVEKILNLKDVNMPLDASDALGVALCHLQQFRYDD